MDLIAGIIDDLNAKTLEKGVSSTVTGNWFHATFELG